MASPNSPIRVCDQNLRVYHKRFILISEFEVDWNEQMEALLLLGPAQNPLHFCIESVEELEDEFHYEFEILDLLFEDTKLTLHVDRELELVEASQTLGRDLEFQLKVPPRILAHEAEFKAELDTSLFRHLEKEAYWRLRFSSYLGIESKENQGLIEFSSGWQAKSPDDPFYGTINASAVTVSLKPGFRTNKGEVLERPLAFTAALKRPAQIFFPRGYRFVWPTLAGSLPFHSVGHQALLVRIVRAEASDLPSFREWFAKRQTEDYGTNASFRYFEASDPKRLESFSLNISPFLKLKLGCLVLQVKGVPRKRKSDSGNRLIWEKIWRGEPETPNDVGDWDSTVFVIVTGRQISVVSDGKTYRQFWHAHPIPGSKPHLEPDIVFPERLSTPKPTLRLYHLMEREDSLPGEHVHLAGWAWTQIRPGEYSQKLDELTIGNGSERIETPVHRDGSFAVDVQMDSDVIQFYGGMNETLCCATRFLTLAQSGKPAGCLAFDEGERVWSERHLVSGWAGFPTAESRFELWVDSKELTPRFRGFPEYFFGYDSSERPLELMPGEHHSNCHCVLRRSESGVKPFQVEVDLKRYQGRPLRLNLRSAVLALSPASERRERLSRQLEYTIHPAEVYLGLKPASLLLGPGEEFRADFVCLTPEGEPSYGHKVRLLRAGDSGVFSSEETARFSVPIFGENLLEVEVVDSDYRVHRWGFTVYRYGAPTPQEFCLHFDRFRYTTERPASMLFCCPYPGRAVVQIGQGVAREIRRLELDAGEHLWEFELLETYAPEASVKIDFLYFDEFAVPRHRSFLRTFEVDRPSSRLHLEVELEDGKLTGRVIDCQGLWVEEASALLWIRERGRADRANEPPPDPIDSLCPPEPCLLTSFHSWSEDKMWLEESVAREVRLRARKQELKKCVTFAYPPLEDSRFADDRPCWSLLQRFSGDRNGRLTSELALPDRWGVYDVSLVVVAPNRASATWTTPLAIGPIFWLFEPAPALVKAAKVELSLVLESRVEEALPVEVRLRGTGFRLEEAAITEVLQPDLQLQILFEIWTEDVDSAEFECQVSTPEGSVVLKRSSFLYDALD